MTTVSDGLIDGSRAPGAGSEVVDLLADLHRLPAQRPALLRVVQVADSPDCSVPRLADAAALDPAFAARLLHLANSAYYGRTRRVTAIAPAVAVLGAETLRGLAVTMALGMSGERGPLPEGFADRAATTAAGSQLVAPAAGAEPGDAFCVGLLREVGQALLYRADVRAYRDLLRTCDDASLAEAERAWCGTTNGELAAAALGAAGLPASVCAAIAQHQRDDELGTTPVGPLARALRGGTVLAHAVTSGDVDEDVVEVLRELSVGLLDEQDVRALALRTAAEAAALSSAMR